MQCRSVAGRNRVPAEIWQLSPWNLLLILTRILRFSLQPQEPSPLCSLRPWFSEPLGLEMLDLVVIFSHSLAYRFPTRKTPETLIPPQVKSKPRLPTGHRLLLESCGLVVQWKTEVVLCKPFQADGSHAMSVAGARPCGVFRTDSGFQPPSLASGAQSPLS